MKKFFRFAAILMVGALVAIACKEKPTPDKPDGPDGPDNPDTPAQTASVKVAIDGDFSDWDQITEEVAGKDDFICFQKFSSDDPILVLKSSSDGDNVYFYAEMLIEYLPQTSICAEWGDSWNGAANFKGDGDENEGVSESRPPFNLFFDPDGKESTGFYTYADEDGDPVIAGLGSEMCAQNLFFFNPTTKKIGVAWNQTNIGPSKQTDENGNEIDYDYNGTIFQADWPDNVIPQWGWQNGAGDGTGDNVAPKPGDIQSAVKDASVVRVEFSIEKSELVNLKDEDKEYAWGVVFFDHGAADPLGFGPLRAAYAEE